MIKMWGREGGRGGGWGPLMGDRPSYPDQMVLLAKQLLLDLLRTSTLGGMSWSNHHLEKKLNTNEFSHEKTNNLGFQPAPTKTDLYSLRRKLES